jgi:uncharacterized membrane protein
MAIDWGIVARAVHVLAVVVWIGGVWLITTVLLPAMREKPPETWLQEFDAIERRFAPQARIAVLLVMLSGLYMLYRYDMWDRFAQAEDWWMDLMVAVWLVFAVLLFFIEPLALGRAVREQTKTVPAVILTRMLWLHRLLLALSLLAIFAAVAGSYGLL